MAAISVTDLTQGEVAGNGVFDALMRATEAHLQQEYEKNRIKGSEYATVYLGALQTTMNQALQFLLQQQKTDLEAQLIEAQIVTEGLNQAHIQAQTTLVEQQTTNAVTENTVLVAQECKLRAEYDLLMEQKLKTIGETALLNQKKVTEQAQTSGTGVDTDSVIGKQKTLYTSQSDGFKRDAEQKAAKLMVDTWNVRQTTDGALVDTNGLDDPNIKRAVDSLLAGINA